ncbi:MAG TPA: hypothetical protein VGH37_04755 [Candidatus Acidoferrum sp.]
MNRPRNIRDAICPDLKSPTSEIPEIDRKMLLTLDGESIDWHSGPPEIVVPFTETYHFGKPS